MPRGPHEIARLAPEDVYKELGSNKSGLTTAEALSRSAHFGANLLPPLPPPPMWKRFFRQFRDLFAILLLIASAISFVTYRLSNYDPYALRVSIAILAVVIINAIIGFVQGYMAERATRML